MITEHSVSTRRACKEVGLSRSTFEYKAVLKNDEPIIEVFTLLTEQIRTLGFWNSFYRIRRMNYTWNHKRVYRVYIQMGLNIRRRPKKRLPARAKQELFQLSRINQDGQ